ncbi:MAG: aspartate carbamoyltransferase regulatory subunit [Firmicutes bacterium]|nr:aspartate carbamoyltransferase regulatory subunit [Clostridiales bacterium]MBQ9932048.1 aspartate carbamoyltransferase regulatory subunit [Bacillota bacterium]
MNTSLNVSSLYDGIVIDHITQGHGYKIFQQLGLDKIDAAVVLIRNVKSSKMGRKDLIKVETTEELNLDVLGLIDPGITVNYIRNGEKVRKIKMELPQKVKGILTCKNPRCITNQEAIKDITFRLVDPVRKEYACEYCDVRTSL